MLDDVAPAQPDGDKLPVLLDLFAGANAPLTKAFMWCGWKAVTPIDLEIDPDFDVTEPSVQRALLRVLPEVLKLLSSQRPCHAPPNPVLERNPLDLGLFEMIVFHVGYPLFQAQNYSV